MSETLKTTGHSPTKGKRKDEKTYLIYYYLSEICDTRNNLVLDSTFPHNNEVLISFTIISLTHVNAIIVALLQIATFFSLIIQGLLQGTTPFQFHRGRLKYNKRPGDGFRGSSPPGEEASQRHFVPDPTSVSDRFVALLTALLR